jgi:hypothetical protein
MPCCILALLAILGPRFVLLMLWIFNNAYLSRVFDNFFVPCLGFVFLPWTTLAYAFAINSNFVGSQLFGLDTTGIIVVLLGLVLDIFAHGGGGYGNRSRIRSYAR